MNNNYRVLHSQHFVFLKNRVKHVRSLYVPNDFAAFTMRVGRALVGNVWHLRSSRPGIYRGVSYRRIFFSSRPTLLSRGEHNSPGTVARRKVCRGVAERARTTGSAKIIHDAGRTRREQLCDGARDYNGRLKRPPLVSHSRGGGQAYTRGRPRCTVRRRRAKCLRLCRRRRRRRAETRKHTTAGDAV